MFISPHTGPVHDSCFRYNTLNNTNYQFEFVNAESEAQAGQLRWKVHSLILPIAFYIYEQALKLFRVIALTGKNAAGEIMDENTGQSLSEFLTLEYLASQSYGESVSLCERS